MLALEAHLHHRPPAAPARVPFRIRAAGRVSHERHHATAGTYHDDVMLTLIVAGRGFYYASGSSVQLGQGYLGLVLPQRDPGVLVADPAHPYDHYYCRFAGQEALRMAGDFLRLRSLGPFALEPRWPELKSMLEAMLTLYRGAGENHWMTQAEGELARFLACLLESPARARPSLTAAALRCYLLEHASKPFALDEAAQHFGISRHQLCRQARRLLGAPLTSVSVKLRLETASLLLQTALPLTVTEIALRVGYEDPLYFSKVFRRHFGQSPTEYRKRRNGSS